MALDLTGTWQLERKVGTTGTRMAFSLWYPIVLLLNYMGQTFVSLWCGLLLTAASRIRITSSSSYSKESSEKSSSVGADALVSSESPLPSPVCALFEAMFLVRNHCVCVSKYVICLISAEQIVFNDVTSCSATSFSVKMKFAGQTGI